MKGDVNNDNLLTYKDWCTISRHFAIGGSTDGTGNLCCYDANSDARISSLDGNIILTKEIEGLMQGSQGGTNTEFCGGCGSNSCNLCSSEDNCYNAGCAWTGTSCTQLCNSDSQCASSPVRRYCSDGHCCAEGSRWNPTLNRGLGGCREFTICNTDATTSSRHTPYLPETGYPKSEACCLRNDLGRSMYVYQDVRTY